MRIVIDAEMYLGITVTKVTQHLNGMDTQHVGVEQTV